jgi:hypothetical protein
MHRGLGQGRSQKMSGSAPSPEKVAACRFTKAQPAEWGFGWPPPKGWRKQLERRWRAEQRAKTVTVTDLPEDDSWVAWL